MKPERMRVRIAEYLGAKWYWARISNVPGKRAKCLKFKQPEGRWYECNGDEPIYNLGLDVPDYPNDLQACHAAEDTLSNPQRRLFGEHLAQILNREKDGWSIFLYCKIATTGEEVFKIAHATALQRSEAFCRTVGIWEEEPAEQSKL